MRLTTAQHDRAAGVLLTTAVGDALGVPYEFATPPGPGELAEMKGGGLGNLPPGEWSDDTSMAVAIAEVAATGADLTSDEALDAIAEGFLRWYDGHPPDIGIQTSAVLGRTRRRLDAGETGAAGVMREEAERYARENAHSAGNGALMRTAGVALAHLDDRDHLARAARGIAELTHADPLAGDACVLWCEAIRLAVLGEAGGPHAGLDLLPDGRRSPWRGWLDDATDDGTDPARFRPNGFTVTALQAALASVTTTPVPDAALEPRCLHLQRALHTAVRIGDDTDTVAAIAGGLLGATWGASAVPWRWRRAVHGWPGLGGRDLVALASLTVSGGRVDPVGWPLVDSVDYGEPAGAVVPHPYDPGVLLGTSGTTHHDADAVVSLCRVGRHQTCFGGATEVVESRLVDSDGPAANPHLDFVLLDAADAVRGLRAEGKTVLVHCVSAHHRAPSVAVAYAVLLGHDLEQARRDVRRVLRSTRASGVVWDGVAELTVEKVWSPR
ncbi:ADP-ribosyl-[dinitrogen reductase] glycohydrolase [Nocardioides dokdonensis FR1436]|uniref:ADP-ribosyl-[dinitrogen reductase] glycohydrolase n=1 Tax=Nocardioides dokdonensis FR1436 TaxID=1300347 RepID=A0A1A9GLJ4_9ACTN|nr:ADP-ribosylglycohydrolase family protein [Nocardioides dokdonensis]ANH38351.1 ADP-ribosyl-[dinitrogen reductase] glycohydrolase [Nocardioides dokdonensis FR1436]